jgi:hypothetical protein
MDQRNIAGKQVGQLRQKQSRAQITHQALVKKGAGLVGFADTGKNCIIGCNVAFAAARRDDHVGAVKQFGVAGNAGVAQCQAGGIGAGALPEFHLALVRFLRDLLVEAHRRKLMHDVRSERLVVVKRRIASLEVIPIRFHPLAETREQTDAGDPHLAATSHFTGSLKGYCRRSAQSRIA